MKTEQFAKAITCISNLEISENDFDKLTLHLDEMKINYLKNVYFMICKKDIILFIQLITFEQFDIVMRYILSEKSTELLTLFVW